jgi:hypothetical protein
VPEGSLGGLLQGCELCFQKVIVAVNNLPALKRYLLVALPRLDWYPHI